MASSALTSAATCSSSRFLPWTITAMLTVDSTATSGSIGPAGFTMSAFRLPGFVRTLPSRMWKRRLNAMRSSYAVPVTASHGSMSPAATATAFATSDGNSSIQVDVTSSASPTRDMRVRGPVCVCVAATMTFPPGIPVRDSTCSRIAATMSSGMQMTSQLTSAARSPAASNTRALAYSSSRTAAAKRSSKYPAIDTPRGGVMRARPHPTYVATPIGYPYQVA